MYYIKSVKRALDIINLYTVGNFELGVTEVAEKLNITKGTASRIMATLASEDMVTRTRNSMRYQLGVKIMKLAQIFILNADICTLALQYMEELKEKTGESIAIDILEGDERVCVAVVESANPLRHVLEVRKRGPLHAGAPGKLILSSLPDDKVDEIIARTGLPKYTSTTIAKKQNLKKEIKRIRKLGISLSNGEHLRYCFGVSAPIRNYSRQIIAALTIAGVAIRINPKKLEVLQSLVKDTASKISQDLGYWDVA